MSTLEVPQAADIYVNSSEPLAPRPLPSVPAQLIRSDKQAIEVAEQLAEQFAAGAARRDREGILPVAELEAFSQSGLWGINVPKAYGGAEVSYATVARVISIISAADSALGQIPQNHLAGVAHLIADGSESQKQRLLAGVLRGERWGNAFSEKGSKTVADFRTTLTRQGDHLRVNGEKFYATGALLAHKVHTVAVDEQGLVQLVVLNRDSEGLTVINNWSSFGQRTTASGSVVLDNVRATEEDVIPVWKAFDRPTAAGAISQIIQAAVDAGIARGTIADTVKFINEKSRPWIDSGQEKASQDIFTIAAIGDLKIRLHAAESLLWRAGQLIDEALKQPNEQTVAAASVATAEAKVLTTEVALQAGNKLFELAGTRSTLEEFNLDRHWRNARTHTLHDPVRWKYFHVGNYYLNNINPPRHAWN
ncbi:SfnB family sulfur acquisition oxidoreductase [Tatumella citrea]|uniref:Dibenzothiophene monooxygenase n=1 Tax=Tatumella citrea TaxID=53336 RepID=A0A1Y0L4Q9_TATCI|nr:SfnB family sulfur acquisition oxidoreductase [Tatumella citrea]ARU92659.1 SfnB family sulfur acquisition oxidoreductase [Tatumella citrea]ARU96695.1 SfnB family sulfur acquisition oxidoreductase [Tatumella citrea]